MYEGVASIILEAETSLTFPRLAHVVDVGKSKKVQTLVDAQGLVAQHST